MQKYYRKRQKNIKWYENYGNPAFSENRERIPRNVQQVTPAAVRLPLIGVHTCKGSGPVAKIKIIEKSDAKLFGHPKERLAL